MGMQDQVAAAFGGFNQIEFHKLKGFHVKPLPLSDQKKNALKDHLMLFFTGFQRNASDIAKSKIENIPAKQDELHRLKDLVDEAVDILNKPVKFIDEFGKLLHQSWLLKRQLSDKVSNEKIDEYYDVARKAGAIGGKLCGAGGGGFLLLYVPPQKQKAVKTALKELLHVPFDFESQGSQIIMYSPDIIRKD